jgi:hypothetical protein
MVYMSRIQSPLVEVCALVKCTSEEHWCVHDNISGGIKMAN